MKQYTNVNDWIYFTIMFFIYLVISTTMAGCVAPDVKPDRPSRSAIAP